MCFIGDRNAQVIVVGSEDIRDVIKGKIGVEIEKTDQSHETLQADIFNKLKVRNDQIPIRPLTGGKLE
jgi:hypothetical protein